MSTNINPGKHICKTTGAVIYESKSGAVMCRISLDIGMTGGICLIQKDGTVSQRGFEAVMRIFNLQTWNWLDWDDPNKFAGFDVEAEVVITTHDGRRFLTVKNINPVKDALTSSDLRALAAKYSGKTKILFGANDTTPAIEQSSSGDSDKTDLISAWRRFSAMYKSLSKQEIEQKWFELTERAVGKRKNFTHDDIQAIIKAVDEHIPF